MQNSVNQAILEGLAEQISAVTGIFVIERSSGAVADRLILTNFQGTIQIGLLPYGVHVVKFGYSNDDCVYDYEDPDLVEKIIARCLYLQDIGHHKRNEEIRRKRAK